LGALDRRAGLQGFVHDRFQGNDFSAVVADIGGDDQMGFGVVDTAGQCRGAETGIDDTVDHADARAGQHGHDLLGNLREINRDAVALLQAQLLEGVGAAIHLAIELPVGEDALGIVLADPDDGDFVFPSVFDMAIEAVIGNVAGGADKPFGERVVPFQDFAPGGKPVEFLGDSVPEGFRVGDRLFIFGLVILDMGCGFGFGARLVGSAFLQQGLDLLTHDHTPPRSIAVWVRGDYGERGFPLQPYNCTGIGRVSGELRDARGSRADSLTAVTAQG
jgi:hypothetical protein